MIAVGLTGSIGMGKSTVAKMFAERGAAVWDADSAVHRLYSGAGEAVRLIGARFGDVIVDGAVDRAALAAIVLKNRADLEALEAIVHPLVAKDREAFLKSALESGAPMVVLDIPLLFENNADGLFHAVVVVSAPADVQRARVLAREGMTPEKLDAILQSQMPDAEKRQKADYVIDTSLSLDDTRREVAEIFDVLMANPPPLPRAARAAPPDADNAGG
ncbi:MAG: dephospho-CoA kinase [Pseudomonadota bacterium]